MKEISLIISIKGNPSELHRDMFGLGEKVTDPEILKYAGENTRYINTEAEIIDGVKITIPKGRKEKIQESFIESGYVDAWFVINVLATGYGISELAFKITNWLLDKTQQFEKKVIVDGKELKTKEEIKKALEEILEED
ncbi:MAG: hypothetical protein K5793_08940 [Nitrosarchaeum sp.]|nr:hypothetical protein [Nitrosarchaeum sp.]